ncbi:MAG: NTP transferase domain-containing protein [Oligoflexia bacterium]|nr:NTP transferase domain-containing protein [Oligoflexia bacterium]
MGKSAWSDISVVVLAGGSGSRFWPVSRQKKPKQFLSLSPDGDSLIQATVARLAAHCSAENLYVISNVEHAALVKEHTPQAQLLVEPLAKNTAASIGLAALHLRRANRNAVMIVLPADHVVKDAPGLLAVLEEAAQMAREKDVLVTLGITPSFPHTGYGYLKRGAPIRDRTFQLSRFFEKPNLERAQLYVQSGEYFWNSGMFVWRVRTILDAISHFMPDLAHGLAEIDQVLGTPSENEVITRVFAGLESVSIDFGVLEHARNCMMVAAPDIGWNDVGSWDAWADLLPHDGDNNVVVGDAMLLGSSGCVVNSEKRFCAVVGARNLVVVDVEDALLVCPRDKVQDVKKVVEELKHQGRKALV